MARLGLGVFGKKTSERKCGFHHIVSRVRTLLMIYDCLCWPWSPGWTPPQPGEQVSLLKSYPPPFLLLAKESRYWDLQGNMLPTLMFLELTYYLLWFSEGFYPQNFGNNMTSKGQDWHVLSRMGSLIRSLDDASSWNYFEKQLPTVPLFLATVTCPINFLRPIP